MRGVERSETALSLAEIRGTQKHLPTNDDTLKFSAAIMRPATKTAIASQLI
jgi:hypothetical protein